MNAFTLLIAAPYPLTDSSRLIDQIHHIPWLILSVLDLCLAIAFLALWRSAPDFPVFRSAGLLFAFVSALRQRNTSTEIRLRGSSNPSGSASSWKPAPKLSDFVIAASFVSSGRSPSSSLSPDGSHRSRTSASGPFLSRSPSFCFSSSWLSGAITRATASWALPSPSCSWKEPNYFSFADHPGLDRFDQHCRVFSDNLQNAGSPRPSGDIALQERCEVHRARWKLLAAITDLIEVQIHDGVNQSAHHHFSVSACS